MQTVRVALESAFRLSRRMSSSCWRVGWRSSWQDWKRQRFLSALVTTKYTENKEIKVISGLGATMPPSRPNGVLLSSEAKFANTVTGFIHRNSRLTGSGLSVGADDSCLPPARHTTTSVLCAGPEHHSRSQTLPCCCRRSALRFSTL